VTRLAPSLSSRSGHRGRIARGADVLAELAELLPLTVP
jgi:hypothetical protein